MAEFIRKNARGSDNTTDTTSVAVTSPEDITRLSAVDVKTNVVDQSVKIVSGTAVLAIVNIPTITSWSLAGTRLTILGANPLTLNFLSASEAINGESRLAQIINGATLS